MSVLSARPPPLTNQAVSALATIHFNFTSVSESTIKPLPSYYDTNYYLQGHKDGQSQAEFILKVFNPLSTSYQCLEGIIQVMKHLSSCGIACPDPLVSCTGKELIELSSAELLNETSSGDAGGETVMKYPVCMLTYIPGEVFDEVDKKFLTPELIGEVGELMGRIDKELMDNFPLESFASTVSDNWNLLCFPKVHQYLSIIDDPHNKANTENTEKVIKAFEEHVSPKLSSFRTGIIHADVNGLNIIIKQQPCDNVYHLAGFIDFIDTINTCIIFDLGISVAHMMRDNLLYVGTISKAVELVGPLIGAYDKILPLTTEELDSLYHLVLARCVLVAVNGARHLKEEPHNAIFLSHTTTSWRIVDALLSIPKPEVDKVWRQHISRNVS